MKIDDRRTSEIGNLKEVTINGWRVTGICGDVNMGSGNKFLKQLFPKFSKHLFPSATYIPQNFS